MNATILTLLKELEDRQIPWCSWKNNHLLNDVMDGKKDLDLFVPLSTQAEFLKVLLKLGFIEGRNQTTDIPFVAHYYHAANGAPLIHLHVYFRLMTGESHLKDYMLPLEQQMIERRVKNENSIYVPDPELQRLIFVLRYFLKNSSLIGSLMYWRENEDYEQELRSIKCERVGGDLSRKLDSRLITRLDTSLNAGRIRSWYLGWKLRRFLKPYRRMTSTDAFFHRYTNFIQRLINRYWFKHKKKLTNGGRFIAITGLDGSGKTTLIREISKILKKDFTVKTVHLGKPPPTILTILSRVLIGLRHRLKRSSRRDLIQQNENNKTGLLAAIRYLALAYERNKLSKKIFRSLCVGQIVISDRYPSTSLGKMDSPKIQSNNQFIYYLSKLERKYYRTILKPDLLIQIYVPFDVAAKRNENRLKIDKETQNELRDRYQINQDLKYDVDNIKKFENSNCLTSSTQSVLKEVWKVLN